ncbi:hypothetical protein GCM10029992_24680 [Glycomyces albus]
MSDQPYGPRYSQTGPPPKPNAEHAFEDRIKLGRDVVVGAVLALAVVAFSAASAWYGMLVADAFWTPVPIALLAVAFLLFLTEVWYFVLRRAGRR